MLFKPFSLCSHWGSKALLSRMLSWRLLISSYSNCMSYTSVNMFFPPNSKNRRSCLFLVLIIKTKAKKAKLALVKTLKRQEVLGIFRFQVNHTIQARTDKMKLWFLLVCVGILIVIITLLFQIFMKQKIMLNIEVVLYNTWVMCLQYKVKIYWDFSLSSKQQTCRCSLSLGNFKMEGKYKM